MFQWLIVNNQRFIYSLWCFFNHWIKHAKQNILSTRICHRISWFSFLDFINSLRVYCCFPSFIFAWWCLRNGSAMCQPTATPDSLAPRRPTLFCMQELCKHTAADWCCLLNWPKHKFQVCLQHWTRMFRLEFIGGTVT